MPFPISPCYVLSEVPGRSRTRAKMAASPPLPEDIDLAEVAGPLAWHESRAGVAPRPGRNSTEEGVWRGEGAGRRLRRAYPSPVEGL